MLTKEEKYIKDRIEDVNIMKLYQVDPFLFIKDIWKLVPQRVKPQYKDKLLLARKERDYTNITLDMFEPFQMGKHITWQQCEILWGVKQAIQKKDKRKISVASGHGIGKSAILSIVIIWYLFVFPDAQVPCTSPSQQQMYDVLWKETAKWINRMPDVVKNLYEHQQSYIRMVENPKEWFARAATGRKENPEALAGVHADYVCMVADEASGIAQEVFDTSKGALTNENVILLLIGNPTRLDGYFFDSHNKLKDGFQIFQFSGTESPVVNTEFIKDIIDEYGIDSDEYKIRVLGEFPDSLGVDDEGWVNLIDKGDLNYTTDGEIRPNKLGVDPAGDGSDEDIMVVRDEFKARIDSIQKLSDEKKTAQTAISIATKYGVKKEDTVIDNFGVGANVGLEMAAAGYKPFAVNVGNKKLMTKKDLKRFENPRALAYWELRTWLKNGGELVNNKKREDLLMIKYKRNLNGKIQIMGKKDMKKKYGKSPDCADALMLTFIKNKKILEDMDSIVCEF